ncbi:MAG: hypothetical protein KI785_05405, partial [Devosiaceae bacterium]|nr:hypothetical protein [Devosiaceae bacterium MH13]
WRRAALQEISVLELLFAPRFGPYASRTSADALYDLLDGTEVRIVRPATSEPMALGTVGEVQVRDRASEAWFSTGMLSALELVPHNHRAPRLTGWLGPADAALTLKTGQRIGAEQLASVVGYHEAVLDARLLVGARRAPETDPDLTLQVETEAGAWIEADLAQRMQKAVGLVDLRIERVLPGALAMTGRAVGYRAASTLGARA